MNKPTTIDEILPDGYRIVTSKAKAELATLLRSVVPSDIDNPYPEHEGEIVPNWQAIHHAFDVGVAKTKDQINQAINKIVGDK